MELYTHRILIRELMKLGIVERIADPDSKKGEYKYLYSIKL